MNALADKYGDKLVIYAVPCNQFGHQTNENADEFLNTLEHVRPGSGFKLSPSIRVTEKFDVNGEAALPLFKWMKSERPVPVGEGADLLINPRAEYGGTTLALWTPVCRSDIAWNFEKFLIGADGAMVQRYSRYYDTNTIADDIDQLVD